MQFEKKIRHVPLINSEEQICNGSHPKSLLLATPTSALDCKTTLMTSATKNCQRAFETTKKLSSELVLIAPHEWQVTTGSVGWNFYIEVPGSCFTSLMELLVAIMLSVLHVFGCP